MKNKFFICTIFVFTTLVLLFGLAFTCNNDFSNKSIMKMEKVSFSKSSLDTSFKGSFKNVYKKPYKFVSKSNYVSTSDFHDFLNNIENYMDEDTVVEGYFTKMEDDQMYYFIADDMCLGCDGVNSENHFIEVSNVNNLDLTDIWTDDFVKVSGYITLREDNGYTYPLYCMTSIEMIQETIRG